MEILPATADDANGIATAHVRSWQVAYAGILDPAFLAGLSVEQRAERWRGILVADASQTLVAHEPAVGGVAGFISHGPWRDDEADGAHGEVWALYTHPDAWGQGVGRALMSAAVDALQAQGRHTVSLWVLSANERGMRFYRAQGFQPVDGSAKRFELGGRQVEEVCMRKMGDASAR